MRSNDSQKQGRAQPFLMPNASASPARFDNFNNDFLSHPAQFPLRYRRRSLMPSLFRKPEPLAGDVGLCFHSEKYLPAGSTVDLEIPLRGRVQRFTATVVMVRERHDGFEIGPVVLLGRRRAARAHRRAHLPHRVLSEGSPAPPFVSDGQAPARAVTPSVQRFARRIRASTLAQRSAT
jgi:hypothetical protein